MKTAIIDVGSNSVRYALMDENTEIAKKEIDSTVLADGLFFSGRLKADAIERTADAIKAFCEKAKRAGAEEIFVFATEAVRAAQNRDEFLQAVKSRTNITVDVIDGDTEASVGFFGAAPSPDKTVAVFDIGGASTEIICGKNGEISYEKSNPIGCVRLFDGADSSRERAQELIEAALCDSLPAVDALTGIGGTATALGAMAVCPALYDAEKVHGSIVERGFLQDIAERFFAGENLMEAFPSLTANRARVIGYGALVSLAVLNKFGFDSFTVSERDNIEGYYMYKKCI